MMQKLVLVDEFDREYKRLQRPAAAVAKTDHSLRLSDTLRNAAADDRKVRRYIEELHRYLNVDKRPTPSQPKINWISEPQQQQQQTPGSSTRAPPRKKKKAKRNIQPTRLEWAQYKPSVHRSSNAR